MGVAGSTAGFGLKSKNQLSRQTTPDALTKYHAPISTISRSVTSHFLHDDHLSLLAPLVTQTHHARADAPCARQIVSPPAHQITHTPISFRQKETPTNTTPYKEVPAFIIPAHCM